MTYWSTVVKKKVTTARATARWYRTVPLPTNEKNRGSDKTNEFVLTYVPVGIYFLKKIHYVIRYSTIVPVK